MMEQLHAYVPTQVAAGRQNSCLVITPFSGTINGRFHIQLQAGCTCCQLLLLFPGANASLADTSPLVSYSFTTALAKEGVCRDARAAPMCL